VAGAPGVGTAPVRDHGAVAECSVGAVGSVTALPRLHVVCPYWRAEDG
jgi:hypothetical protein